MILLTASASSGRYADTGPITTVHLILIAVLIVLVIVAIVWGARQKRARVEGERVEAERAEAMLAHPQTETAISPAPPPLGDAGVTAMAPVAEPVAKPAPRPKTAAAKPAAAKVPIAAPAARKPAAKPASSPKPAAAKPVAEKSPTAKPAAPKPPAKPKPAPVAASQYGLIDVKGLGPKAVPLLNALGIASLSDLAALSPARAAEIDGQLGVLSGRLTRDRWVDQAKLLAAGDVAAFEAAYGKL